MHLVYLDESGNTATNLNDSEQPIFLLAALIVPGSAWQPLERDLEEAIARHVPMMVDGNEVHAVDLRSGRGRFKAISVGTRIALRDEWLRTARKHDLKVVYRAIVKERYQNWLHSTFGSVQTRPLQLCDVCALIARKKEERKAGIPGKSIDHSGIKLLEPLIIRRNESLQDVLAWLAEQRTPGAQKQ